MVNGMDLIRKNGLILGQCRLGIRIFALGGQSIKSINHLFIFFAMLDRKRTENWLKLAEILSRRLQAGLWSPNMYTHFY